MKTAICAIIKDEHLFLDEWINWHFSIGFNVIHLFEDKDSKSHFNICNKYDNVYLRRYEEEQQVREILKEQGSAHRQTVLYQWFGDTYKNIYDWVAFIDIDEFIVFTNGYNLIRFCDEYASYPAVLMSWKMFGANNHVKRPDCKVMEAYTEYAKEYEYEMIRSYKSFCNLKKWTSMVNNHEAKGCVNVRLDNDFMKPDYSKVSLNHYFTKSWEDWCVRIFDRGDTESGHRKLVDFFGINSNMLHLKDELVNNVSDRTPFGSIPKEDEIIVKVGNIRKITSRKKINEEHEKETLKEDKVVPIFDLGFYDGDTSLYYLNNGYKVIGVECNPSIIESNTNKYDNFIKDGKLVIVEKCVSKKDDVMIPFYISTKPVWSSCTKQIAERKEKSKKVSVVSTTLSSLIKEYGCPIYCKIDIEGNDVFAVRSLKGLDEIPKYISVEAECLYDGKTVSNISMLNELKKVGYTKFFIIDNTNKKDFIFDFRYEYDWISYDEAKMELDILREKEWDYGLWVDIYACK